MSEDAPQVSFDDEKLIIVDEQDNILGYRDKWECHQGKGILHRAFSIFIFNNKGEVIIQRRSTQKPLWPRYWSNSCCSHPRQGETLALATERRLSEELGIRTELHHLYTFQYYAEYEDVGVEREMCAVLIGRSDDSIIPNPNEIDEWKFISIEKLSRALVENPMSYSPWIRMEWKRMMADHRDEIDALNR